jgi:META domain-containing protein
MHELKGHDMTLKTLSAALVAASLLGTAVQADITIIQSGPMPGASALAPQLSMQGSGFGIASAFIRDMAAARMPGFVIPEMDTMDAIDAPPIIAPPADPIAFAGRWSLIEIFDANAGTLRFPDILVADAGLNIAPEGEFNASAGCNSIFGRMEQNEGMVEIGEVMATLMACDEPTMRLERALIDSLSDAALFANGYDRLVFLDAEGRPLARFSAEID